MGGDSLPGAPTQHWHQDAGALFPRTGLHLPAHGVVAFLAVDNVTRDMGPTEFVAGTHVGCAPGEDPQPAAIGDGTSIDVCSAAKVDKLLYGEGAQGSVILFDFRIMHRGGPNSSKTPRPLLYSTYLREWYYDKVNFMQSYTRKFDALTPQQKKLFNRCVAVESAVAEVSRVVTLTMHAGWITSATSRALKTSCVSWASIHLPSSPSTSMIRTRTGRIPT